MDCLLQVNFAGTAGQGGVRDETEFLTLLQAMRKECPLLRVCGVMAVGEENFGHAERMSHKFNLPARSLGMSHDYATAVVDYGATLVRLGTTIFGPRAYPPVADCGDCQDCDQCDPAAMATRPTTHDAALR